MLRLSDAEWKRMDGLWKRDSTVMELTRLLGETQGWSKSTVITMPTRLGKKGAVSYREEGRTKHFYPLVNREMTALAEAEGFLDKVYHGSAAAMVNAMAGGSRLTAEDIRELKELLRTLEGDSEGGCQ